jgi:hypothetical protein
LIDGSCLQSSFGFGLSVDENTPPLQSDDSSNQARLSKKVHLQLIVRFLLEGLFFQKMFELLAEVKLHWPTTQCREGTILRANLIVGEYNVLFFFE